MAKLKIISNPYKKETKYQKFDVENSAWVDINYESNPNSKLLKGELTGVFFPFKVEKIIALAIEEYSAEGELLEIYFEGSTDEFNELKAVCKQEKYSSIVKAYRTETILENARDILPEVKELFQEMSPLIVQSVSQEKIQRDLERFSDASSDVVPICVLGNYSAGKSTFINSLIGSEILPSGMEPITAKVYKISRSKFADRAQIKCKYSDFDIIVQFDDKGTSFSAGTMENPLTLAIKEILPETEDDRIPVRVNKVLSVINDFESDIENTNISDLIEVDIPFVNGVLANSQHPFVIFDTPGSNSASNAKHLVILKEAMANMTNGLPIFLSTPDSLDSTDNENLYHIIREMEELDSRFTMIVVNKADSAGIQRRDSTPEEQKRILNQAVPRNLYSGGLFYVSSILGLGAKTDGEFSDYVYEDIYDAQVDRYENPDHKHYRTLYRFDIQPSQLKERSDADAASQTNLVYANSGLYTIEKEIEEFAGRYSAYNKCFQSQMFLNKVILITSDEIEDKKKESEEIRQGIKDKLEADKKALIDVLDQTATENRTEFVDSYKPFMSPHLDGTKEVFSSDELRERETSFTKEQEETLGLVDATDKAKQARGAMVDNLKDNFLNIVKEKNLDAVKDTWSNLQSDFESSKDTYFQQRETRHEADRKASDNLLKYVAETYVQRLQDIYDLLDSTSREYWTSRTESLRETMAKIVSGSEVLTEDRRKELERIIITYQKLSFNDESADTIFNKVNFKYEVKLFDQVIWESDHLNIDKLAKTYNTNIAQGAEARYLSIEESHRNSAFAWIQSLLDEIYENIVDYSPELSKQAKRIKIMTEQIEDLEKRQIRLKQYTEQLIQMMNWKIVEK